MKQLVAGKQYLQRFAPIFAFAIFALAVFLLHKNLSQYRLQDITKSLKEIHGYKILMAIGLTLLSYIVLSIYDVLALRYVGKQLSYLKVALASFISYAFANNTGSLSIIASSSVRYRLYGAWGLSAIDIGKVIVFCMTTFWLGFLSLGGFALLFASDSIQNVTNLQGFYLKILGCFFFTLVTGYLLVCGMRKRNIQIMGWELALPRTKLALGQISVAITDLAFAAGTLYVLLPGGHGLGYFTFLGIFLTAIIAGLISNVPGGLGVFESIVLLLLSPFMEKTLVISSLLVFRAVYYLLPLLTAFSLLAGLELFRRRKKIGKVAAILNKITETMVPHVFALGAFIGGAILMFSGATPMAGGRLLLLKKIVALPVVELSHFFASLAGMGLLVLASGLRKRIDAAYFLTLILLGSGVALSILKGLDYEESVWLLFLLLALLLSRRQFYRKATLLKETMSSGWLGSAFIVIGGSMWLGFFSYKHVEYTHELWWNFTLTGDAPRFLRAEAGIICGAFFFAVYKLFQAAPSTPFLPDEKDLQKALDIIRLSPDSSSYLALLGDKNLLFGEGQESFLMYAVQGQSWIVMGDPVGKTDDFPQLLWNFKSLCDRHGGRPVFYEVDRSNLHLYLDIGLIPMKIGEEGRVLLETFSLEGASRKTLRHSHNRALRDGCSFSVLNTEMVAGMIPTLKAVSDAWLAEKKTQEKGFSLGYFDEKYLKNVPIALVLQGNEVIAFANLLPGGQKEELSIDLMRYLPKAPHGVMDYLFLEIMLWGKNEGYKWFNLGMAPFSGLENRSLSPILQRLRAFVFRHGEHFYNFQGLRFYKDKFEPQWEAKYLAVPGGLSLPNILVDVAALISGGVKGIFSK